MNSPEVSIIIPVKDRHDLAREAIQSVLDQGIAVEVLICDDSLEPFSYQDPRVKILPFKGQETKEKINRIARARNRGLEAASGEYVAFLDSDDYYKPSFLRQSIETTQKLGSDAVCVFSEKVYDGLYPFSKKAKILLLSVVKDFLLLISYVFNRGYLRRDMIYLCQISHMLFRRDKLTSQHFDLQQRFCEDWKFFLDLDINIGILPKSLIAFRYSVTSNTPMQAQQNTGEKEAVYNSFIKYFEERVGRTAFTFAFRIYTSILLIK